MEIHTRNVNQAMEEVLWKVKVMGEQENTRNGKAMVLPEPVTTFYSRPNERVLFCPDRDANPFFHFMESLWMLGGRFEVAFVNQFNSRIKTFSDDGFTFNGAYGRRWRSWFGRDQLIDIIELLKKDVETRRAVMQMWDAETDLMSASKDVPCNTQIYLDARNEKLNMTVTCRSNDLIWGCYGANAVHFSMLQEFISSAVEKPLGVYRQFSNNLHVYEAFYKWVFSPLRTSNFDAYVEREVSPFPLVSVDYRDWLEDLEKFLSDPLGDAAYFDEFFGEVAAPMYAAWHSRKTGMMSDCEHNIASIKAEDWRKACREWVERRIK